MTQEQLDIFIYSCLSYANKAHFDNERNIEVLLGEPLSKSSFTDVIMRNYLIANNQHLGVCFTMACWAYYLLYIMGIDANYYILETAEEKTGFPNYVLLYQVENEYFICDLAAQVRAVEEAHDTLFQIGRNPNYYKKEDLDEALKTLSNPHFIYQSLENYYKDYKGGIIFAATGINDDRIFTEIPKVFLMDFLKNEKMDSTLK